MLGCRGSQVGTETTGHGSVFDADVAKTSFTMWSCPFKFFSLPFTKNSIFACEAAETKGQRRFVLSVCDQHNVMNELTRRQFRKKRTDVSVILPVGVLLLVKLLYLLNFPNKTGNYWTRLTCLKGGVAFTPQCVTGNSQSCRTNSRVEKNHKTDIPKRRIYFSSVAWHKRFFSKSLLYLLHFSLW